MKFKIKEKPVEIHLSQDKWLLWYNEVMRRIKAWEEEVFDVDECMELEVMSEEHFKAMDKFINKK